MVTSYILLGLTFIFVGSYLIALSLKLKGVKKAHHNNYSYLAKRNDNLKADILDLQNKINELKLSSIRDVEEIQMLIKNSNELRDDFDCVKRNLDEIFHRTEEMKSNL